MKKEKYMKSLAVYYSSLFRDFERFLRTEVDLFADDIRSVIDENISTLIISELQRGIYTFKDLSETLFRILQSEKEGFNNTVDNDSDDISMETSLVVRPGIIAIRFDENSFFQWCPKFQSTLGL